MRVYRRELAHPRLGERKRPCCLCNWGLRSWDDLAPCSATSRPQTARHLRTISIMEAFGQSRAPSSVLPLVLSLLLLLLSPVTLSAFSQSAAHEWQIHLSQEVAAAAEESGVSVELVDAAPIPENGPWSAADRLSQCNDSVYHGLVWPLAQMVANTYRFPAVVPVPGWRVSERVPPLGNSVGLHAIVYEEETTPRGSASSRLVVAFRGTQISTPPSLGSLCDLCADALLYNDPAQWLPLYCYLFPRALYDYFHAALPFIQEVVAAYALPSPGATILLTGHSLGGSLATIVSSYFAATTSLGWRFPVVTFSAVGTRVAHLARGVPVPPNDDPRLHNILDIWDPFFQAHSGNQVGNLCFYAPEEPEVCRACYGNGSFPPPPAAAAGEPVAHREHPRAPLKLRRQGVERSWHLRMLMKSHGLIGGRPSAAGDAHLGPTSSYACSKCFFAAHYFRHVLNLIRNSSQPLCLPAPPSTR